MAQNPYQMDPFLAQGFSNLTKALIGDPETDYQVARTNRVKTLLPYEQAQLEAAAAADTSLAGQRDQETANLVALNEALKILESDPTVSQAFIEPLGLAKTTPYGQPINIDPSVTGAMLRAILQGGNPDQRATALDTVGGGRAQRAAEKYILSGNSSEAGRGALLLHGGNKFNDPDFADRELQGNLDLGAKVSEDDLIADKYEDKLRFGEGGQGDRDTAANNKGLKDVAQIKADAEKEWQEAVQKLKNLSEKELAEIKDATARYDIDQTNERLKNENVYKQYITVNGEMIVSPELGQELGIQPDPTTNKYTMSFGTTESMIEVEIENPGGKPTIVKIAPENIEKLNPVSRGGKLIIPVGHKFNTLDPKNTESRIGLIDQEINGAVESGLFEDVPSAVMRKIQSNFTTAAENRDVEDVLRLMRRQLSETFNGETAVTIREGSNFDVPAYIINFLVQPNANLDPNIITKTYGFSLNQANRIINFVRAQ